MTQKEQTIKDLLKEFQKDIHGGLQEQMDIVAATAGASASAFKTNMGGGGTGATNPEGFELTYDFPLYVGMSGEGSTMFTLNAAYEDQTDNTFEMFTAAIDAWSMSIADKKFEVLISLAGRSERRFEGELVEIMVRSNTGELMNLTGMIKKTPFQVRMRMRSVIPEYLEQIDEGGHFYLTGFVDVADDLYASKAFTVKGLGYVATTDILGGAGVVSLSQILLGEEV